MSPSSNQSSLYVSGIGYVRRSNSIGSCSCQTRDSAVSSSSSRSDNTIQEAYAVYNQQLSNSTSSMSSAPTVNQAVTGVGSVPVRLERRPQRSSSRRSAARRSRVPQEPQAAMFFF